MTSEQNFWSRRKAGVQAEIEADKDSADAEALAQDHAALEEQTDEEILVALDLPNPDTLKMGDDFSVFMSKAVPDRLRRRALRTLWRSNPVLANVDMLVDYGEDFTDAAMVVENMQTAYQVGKGMLKHVEEMARQAAEAEADESVPPDVDDTGGDAGDEDVDEVVDEVDADPIIALAESNSDSERESETSIVVASQEDEVVQEIPAPSRMKFKFERDAV